MNNEKWNPESGLLHFLTQGKGLVILCSFFILHFSFLQAQTDSLRKEALKRSFILGDTLEPTFPTLLLKKDTLELPEKKKDPLFGKNAEGRLQLNMKLPGRKRITWKVPKIIYAGRSEFPDPDVSWQRALLVPGWGQVYNGDSWKLPIIYAGYAASGWYYSDRQQTYQNFRRAYRIRVLEADEGYVLTAADISFLENTDLVNTTTDGLRRQRDQVRRQRDYAVLYISAWHLISVAEAFVGGHMKSVDITEDISMKVRPGFIPFQGSGGAAGLGILIQF